MRPFILTGLFLALFSGQVLGDQTIADAVVVPADGTTVNIATGVTDTYSNTITGAGNTLTKTGAGTMVLSLPGGSVLSDCNWEIREGTVFASTNRGGSKTFTGNVTIYQGGTLQLSSDSLGYGSTPATVINIFGGTMTNTNSNETMRNTTFNLVGGTMAKTGQYYWDLYDQNSRFNIIADTDGTLTGVVGTVEAPTISTISGAMRLRAGGAAGTSLTTFNVDANAKLNFTAGIAADSGQYGFTKTGPGTMEMTSAVSIPGPVVIEEGTLSMTANRGNSKTFVGDVTINRGATLMLTVDSLGYAARDTNTNIHIYGTLANNTNNETMRSTNFYLCGGTMAKTGSAWWDIFDSKIRFFAQADTDGTITGTAASADNPTISTISGAMRLREGATAGTSLTTFDVDANAKLVFSAKIDLSATAYGFTKTGAGTMILNRSGGNGGAAIGGISVEGGTLELASPNIGFNVGYFGATPINVSNGATLKTTEAWTLATGKITLTGDNSKLDIASSLTYAQNIELIDGADITLGGQYRVGIAAAPILAVSGTSATGSTITGTERLILVYDAGQPTFTVNVADVGADVDLDICVKVVDLWDTPSYYGMKFAKTGDGTLRLANAGNEFHGSVSVEGGKLMVTGTGENNSLGRKYASINRTLEVKSDASIEFENPVIFDGNYELGGTQLVELDYTNGVLSSNYLTVTGNATIVDGAVFELTSNGVVSQSWLTDENPLIFLESIGGTISGWENVEFDLSGLTFDTPEATLQAVLVQRNGRTYLQAGIITGEVPEPATWVLMVLGLAGGYFIRRRKTQS